MEQTIQHSLTEYGILGIAVLVLGYVTYNQWKGLVKKNKELEAKIDTLQTDMKNYLERDRMLLLQAIDHNTEAFNSLKDIISKLLETSPRVNKKPKEDVKSSL